MKKLLLTFLLIAGTISVMLTYSCKKSDNTTTNTTSTGNSLGTNNQTYADDENMYKSESDEANSEINYDIETNLYSGFARMSNSQTTQSNILCGATVDHSRTDTLIYTFNSNDTCEGRIRSGSITVSLSGASSWHVAGAILTLTFSNYKVTRTFDNKSITFNGTKTLKDNNGFTWGSFLLGLDSINYTERAYNMQITFSGGFNAVWNSARTGAWYIGLGVLNFTCNGDTSFGGYNNVGTWGTDRYNQTFTTYYVSPIHCNLTCAYFCTEPKSGIIVYNVNNATLTLNLGVDSSGNTYTGLLCPYGFKITWNLGNGISGSSVFQYPYN